MPTTKAEASKGESEKKTYRCKRCIAAGVPEEDATFIGYDLFGKHGRDHKAQDEIDKALSKAMGAVGGPQAVAEPQAVAQPQSVPQPQGLPYRKPTAFDHDLATLRSVLVDAGIGARLDSIIDAFTDWDDLAELDRLLSMAGAVVHAKRMALHVWAQHRGIPGDYAHKRYPTSVPPTSVDTVVQPVAVEPKPVDPFDSMMAMMEKQMRMQMMQQQMKMMQSGMTFGPDGRPTGEMPKPRNQVMEMMANQLEMEIMQSQLGQLRGGARVGPDGKPLGNTEEKKMRALDNGSNVEMTDKQWIDYQIGLEERKTQLLLLATKEDKKRESDKIPMKIDGTIVHVPADQVDKYIMLLKSMEPDPKKDIYALMQESEKMRHELQQQHQAEVQLLRDKQTEMLLQRQEQMMQQLQAQMQNRPNPIQEMVTTQTELKEAGILSEGTKDLDQHNMAIQEKKLDTTMNIILQQQDAMNKKTNQLIAVLSPIAQQYAQEAAQNLPKPGETRDGFREKRKAVAQEIMPLNEEDARALEMGLNQEAPEEPEPRKSRVLTVGDGR